MTVGMPAALVPEPEQVPAKLRIVSQDTCTCECKSAVYAKAAVTAIVADAWDQTESF